MWFCGSRIICRLNLIQEKYQLGRLWIKMSSSDTLQYLETNSFAAKELISSIEQQIAAAKQRLADNDWDLHRKNMKAENEALKAEVEGWKSRLIELETQHGIKQIPVPSSDRPSLARNVAAPVKVVPRDDNPPMNEESKRENVEKKKKEKPAEGKKAKAGGSAPSAGAEELPVDVGRLDFRVGCIVSAKKHPDADSLYVEEVDVGEGKVRTVVSGLVKFVPIEEMQGRMAVLLCNLKPAKMRGVMSQAMVMCASTPEKVEILCPPAGSVPGDLVEVDGYPRLPDAVLNPKKKIFETVAPDLKTNMERVATYKGVPLAIPGKGNIMSPSLVGVPIK